MAVSRAVHPIDYPNTSLTHTASASSSMGTAPAPKSASTSPTAHDTHEGDNVRKAPRKLNRSANQLHRNQACLTCRRRRIKCDAGRPHCSSCVRSFRFLARTQPDPERDAGGVQCVYEHGEPPEAEPEGEEDPRLAVAKLEARVGMRLFVYGADGSRAARGAE